MNFKQNLDISIPEKKAHYKKVFLELKIFGWSWVIANLKLDEDFMEEYAENMEWENVLLFQDYSPIFEGKFSYYFLRKCRSISMSTTKEEFLSFLIDGKNYEEYTISELMQGKNSQVRPQKLIGRKTIFTGPKGRQIYERVKDITHYKGREDKDIKIYIVFDEKIKKNSITIRVDMTDSTKEAVFFIT